MDGLLANPWINLGLGILGASGPGVPGAQAIGRGGLLGMESLRQQQQAQEMQRYRQAQATAAQQKLEQQKEKWEQEQRDKLRERANLEALIATWPPEQQAAARAGLETQAYGSMYPAPPTGMQYGPGGEWAVNPAYRQFALERAAAGRTQVNVGGAEKPISVSDLSRLALPGGGTIPFGTTPSQAMGAGAYVTTAEDKKNIGKFNRGLQIVQELKRLALGEADKGGAITKQGAFTGITPGIVGRAVAAGENVYNYVTQDNTTVEEYSAFAEGTLAPLVKALGDTGNIAVKEADRMLKAIPKVWPAPDTEPAARRKIQNIERLILKGLASAQKKGDLGIVLHRAGRGGEKETPNGKGPSGEGPTDDELLEMMLEDIRNNQ